MAAQADTSNVLVRVMASNLSSGSNQRYESPGLHILKGLKPDVVAMQEFNYASTNGQGTDTPAAFREMVDATFGTNFVYFRETNASYTIPNGIISRYPILSSGSWDDVTSINDRGFAWAQIDLPGTNDLYLVSVHLKASSGSETQRATEATNLTQLIQANFPSNAWIIVAGDFNIGAPSEPVLAKFKTYLSDDKIPVDQNNDADSNSGRNERYDYVLASFSMTNLLTPVVMPSRTYSNGLVFDSRVYTSLTDVSPVVSTDSGVSGMQHMGVVKDFNITYTTTNNATAPGISGQPASRTNSVGTTATFSVTATGSTPFSYQWRKSGTNMANGGSIFGVTTDALTLTSVQTNDAGNYSVVVTNAYGNVTSSVATLTIALPTGLIPVTGSSYSENFDSMGSSGTDTPDGWFVGTGTAVISGTTVTVGNGSVASGGNYNFGTTGSSDRALGSLASSSTQRDTEARFINTSGSQISSLTINYTGEEWRVGGTGSVNNQLRLQYSTDGTSFVFLGAAFDFNTPVDSGTAAALDGNSPANRVTNIGGIYTPAAPITNGQTFYLRWADPDDTSADNAVALDDLAIAFTIGNTPPVANPDTFSRAKNVSLKIRISDLLTNDTDSDLDGITFSSASSTSTNGAALTNNGTNIFYLNANNVNDAFTYGISDGSSSATGTVFITISGQIFGSPVTNFTALGTGTNLISFAGIPDYAYVSQFATNLGGTWFNLSTNNADTNGIWTVIDSNATNAQRFYRSATP